MINPVQTSIPQPDGSDRRIIIEPVLEKDSEHGLRPTGVFKIYKDAFDDETVLFTEPAEPAEPAGAEVLPDAKNPDYLGLFRFAEDGGWTYTGDLLDVTGQAELALFIQQYREPDI